MSQSTASVIDAQSDVVVVRAVCAEFDEPHVQQLRAEISEAAGAHPTKPFVLDLAAVSFMPSMSLAALIRLATEFRARQQRLVVAGLQPQLRDLFVLTRLDRLFDLQGDVSAAIQALRPT